MKKILLSMAMVFGSGVCWGYGDFEPVWSSSQILVANTSMSVIIDSHPVVANVYVMKIGGADTTLSLYDTFGTTDTFYRVYVLDVSSNAKNYAFNLEFSSGLSAVNRGGTAAQVLINTRKRGR